jgi:hypothetical protein
MPTQISTFMEYLESEYARARGKTPHDEARRALLACSIAVLQLAEKITRKFKDKESIDTTLNKCIAGDKPLPWKELCELTESIGGIKGKFHDARLAEDKRKEREEKKRLRAEANTIAVAAATATAIQVAADAIAVIAVAKAKKATEVPPVAKPRIEKQKIPKVIKDEIWDYYIGNDVAQILCPCCQKTPITMREFVAGHVLSEKNGGTVTRENIVPICNKCNSSMGARHMIEFTLKHYGHQPICPRNPVVCEEFTPEVAKPITKPSTIQTSNYVRYEHCRVPEVVKPSTIQTSNYVRYEHCKAFSGKHTDAGKFPSEEEAIAHAKTKGYATIVRRANSLAIYYFTDKPCKECKVATSDNEGGWDYVSWRLE